MNDLQQKPERNERGHWVKGCVAPNPKGRPKKGNTLRERISRHLSTDGVEADALDEIIGALVEAARNGDTKAVSILFDRLEGRPAQMVLTSEIPHDELIDI
jgi:hypothetical protein